MSDSSERFELLRLRYAGLLDAKHLAMTQAWAAFAAAPSDTDARCELERQLHRLCGSAEAYGYADLGEHACLADRELRRWEQAAPALRDAPGELVARLTAPMQAVLLRLAEACGRIGVGP